MITTRKRISGPKVVLALGLVVLGILFWAFYRYYTVQPDPNRLHELQHERELQRQHQLEKTGS